MSYETLIVLLLSFGYVFVGIGAAKAIATIKQEQTIRLFCVFFWPIALCVIAVANDIFFDDNI